jgi:hypothetical protein
MYHRSASLRNPPPLPLSGLSTAVVEVVTLDSLLVSQAPETASVNSN